MTDGPLTITHDFDLSVKQRLEVVRKLHEVYLEWHSRTETEEFNARTIEAQIATQIGVLSMGKILNAEIDLLIDKAGFTRNPDGSLSERLALVIDMFESGAHRRRSHER
jgi:hypothetical protein